MKINQPSKITYTKSEDDVSTRTILPISIPTKVVSAIDISGLSEAEADLVKADYTRYLEYRKVHMKSLFNFANWAEHVGSETTDLDIKYRSFSPSKIQVTD